MGHLPVYLEPGKGAYSAFCALVLESRAKAPAGTLLKLDGDETTSVFYVLSGWLLLSKTLPDGQRQIIDVILPGEFVDPESAKPGISAVEVETLTDASVSAIPRHQWRQACHEHGELAKLSHQAGSAALSRISERMVRLGKSAAETIVAFALCELCLRSTDRALVEGKKFHIPMTQQQLGDFCGLSAVHVCRTLRRLERNGVLSVTDHMDIIVHDMDVIAEIAEIDPEALRHEIIPAV